MTPHDVAVDRSRLLRFQSDVAYLDRLQPPKDEVDSDAELLGSKDGGLIVAWLWPTPSYEPRFDPFDADSAANQESRESASRKGLQTASRALDDERQRRLWVVARRFRGLIELTARSVGRPVEDLETHLKWSCPLSPLELGRLKWGHTPFPFPVIVELCSALQLEFTDAWVLGDPQRLARRIDQSVLAHRISDELRVLTLDNLERVARRLPRLPNSPGQAPEPEIYKAPRPGGRYWSLYAALADDARDHPVYTVAEIDRLLVDAGETRLPESAKADRSWWAGNGAKTAGRPQVGAWWAAGYRIRNVESDPSSGQIASIAFEALPGRAEWFTDPERTNQREYRVPGPERVEIYRGKDDVVLAKLAEVDMSDFRAALAPVFDRLRPVLEALWSSYVPDDPDIRRLTQFLDEVGEADRSQIERHFNQMQDKSVDAGWMTNLLTKARRQGWTVNKGTRSQPRWAAPRLRSLVMESIAENLNLEAPAVDPGDPVPVEFLRLVAETVGVDTSSSSVQQIARRIVESSARTWQPEFESADGSVTSLGLKAVGDAIGTRMPPEDEIVVLD